MSLIKLIFASALVIQAVTSQSIGNSLNPGLGYNGVPFAGNYANGLPGPGLPGAGFGGPGLPGPGFGGPGLPGPGFGGPGFPGTASTGGGFTVTSSSSIAPTGVSVLAENLAIEGPLSVGGQMPFLGSVGLGGTLEAMGSGAVSYGCGNGEVGITSEDTAPGSANPGPYSLAGQTFGPAFGPGTPGFGPGLAGPGLAGPLGPGLPGPGFGPGLIGPGFGNGLPGAGFGGLAGKGLG